MGDEKSLPRAGVLRFINFQNGAGEDVGKKDDGSCWLIEGGASIGCCRCGAGVTVEPRMVCSCSSSMYGELEAKVLPTRGAGKSCVEVISPMLSSSSSSSSSSSEFCQCQFMCQQSKFAGAYSGPLGGRFTRSSVWCVRFLLGDSVAKGWWCHRAMGSNKAFQCSEPTFMFIITTGREV